MDILWMILQVYLGLLIFWVYYAHKYIFTMTFNWKKWKEDNLVKFIWSFAVVTLLGLACYIDPKVSTWILKYFGYQMQGDEPTITGVMLGFIFGIIVRQGIKPMKIAPKKAEPVEEQPN